MSAEDLFADVRAADNITTYHAVIQVKDLIVGGIPNTESMIGKWLSARMNLDDVALRELQEQTFSERGDNLPTAAEQVAVAAASDSAPSINGFKRNERGELCYEGRCMKSAIKEAANSAYPGTDWDGKVESPAISKRKGLLSTLEERVFIPDTLISLGVTEPARIEERVKHVMTPQGPRSSIARVEVVERPRLEFEVRVHDDFLSRQAWGRIWTRAQDIGIGADRGRSDGMFELLKWDRIEN